MAFDNFSAAQQVRCRPGKTLAVVNAALVLIAAATGAHAATAADGGPRLSHHGAATHCRARHPRACVDGHARPNRIIQTTIDSGEPTPSGAGLFRSSTAAARPVPPIVSVSVYGATPGDLAASASRLAQRLAPSGASPWRGRGAPSGARLPQAPAAPVARGLVTAEMGAPVTGDVLSELLRRHGDGGGMPALPAPVAWAILLLGLLGLRALTRAPRVAPARSWASWATVRTGSSSRPGGWAVDRIDPERYALAQVRRPHPGRFARAGAVGRFGPAVR